MHIASLEAGLYRIALPVALSDSTHGTITHFELITVRLRDRDGAEGIGYTYTVGAGGAAVHSLIDKGLRPVLLGADADAVEALWQKMWWHLHFGGRGGSVSLAVSACDIALWDLKARRFHTPLWRLLGGFDPAVPRLFIIDGAKALSKAIRRTFGRAAAIQRCQVHKARNIMERLPKSLHASVRRVLRQAWELDDAGKAEKLLRNLAQLLVETLLPR